MGEARTPLATIRSLHSFSLGAASSWLRFWPDASVRPDQSTSPAALARGHKRVSRFMASMNSLQTATSPPSTSLASAAVRLAVGSCE